MCRALSGGRGMLVSDGDKKPHLIRCEATCVYEEVAERISNVRFTKKLWNGGFVWKDREKKQLLVWQ